jgi:hypothetical protein
MPVRRPEVSQREEGMVLWGAPVDICPVPETYGPEFETGAQVVDGGHSKSLLEEVVMRWPHLSQGRREERRDVKRSIQAVNSPLAALPT